MSISGERAIEIGRKLLDREARKYKLSLSKFGEADYRRVASGVWAGDAGGVAGGGGVWEVFGAAGAE